MNNFNEATRVQMPALVHLTRIGYKYLGRIAGKISYDHDTNILTEIFTKQFEKLNPDHIGKAEEILRQIRQELDNDDLGKSFYKILMSVSPVRLIDFDNPQNNTFHCTAEFTCKRDQDEFRPDITLFVNGLPLIFVEVKRPNNPGGMLAESKRMNKLRLSNPKFRRFINITQLMIFSNNMEYDAEGGIKPIQGAFYCTGARREAKFNCFREENPKMEDVAPYIKNFPYGEIDSEVEKKILNDFNNQVLHSSPEYQTNLDYNTPTNRILTSMCAPERLLFILKYGIVYVKDEREVDGKIEITDEKHIIRYQQMFAALAIKDKLDAGKKSGVIWHTQGSGKTALAYHLVNVLTDFYAAKNVVAKFYFIVDRLDLLDQSKSEFEKRGLSVQTANSRDELMKQFRTNQSLEGVSGQREIVVVNIQRFAEDKVEVKLPPYATNLQRIFIIDEAHRGYQPEGSFLLNLFTADKNSVKIALTGTPLLKEERASWKIFGEYFHTYYYDKSIRDGYTLKIIREDIETSYREKLSTIHSNLEKLVQKKSVQKNFIVEHKNYVRELVKYIITDLKKFRMVHGDDTLGGMVICETSEQARKIFEVFDEIQSELNKTDSLKSNFKAGLILYDSGDKETRKKIKEGFQKYFTIDILIVFNMLLTGFDAPRLKRLYFGRKLKDHTLLQAITRVNRPYGDNRYGYVIDFADIKRNFDETNLAYLQELQRFNNPDEVGEENVVDIFAQVLENKDTLLQQMQNVRQILFKYTTDNAEIFSKEISAIENKQELLDLKKVLLTAKDCCNIVRTFGDEDLQQKFSAMEIFRLPDMLREVQRRINIINQKEAFEVDDATKQTINDAMQDIEFSFKKIGEEELKLIAGGVELQDKWRETIHAFTKNIDQDDEEFVTLREAFMQRFKEHGFVIDTVDEFTAHLTFFDKTLERLYKLQLKNKALLRKYNDDEKFARVHKRIKEENFRRIAAGKSPIISQYDDDIFKFLSAIKFEVDQRIYNNDDVLKNDARFKKIVMAQIMQSFQNLSSVESSRPDRIFIQSHIVNQYLKQNMAW